MIKQLHNMINSALQGKRRSANVLQHGQPALRDIMAEESSLTKKLHQSTPAAHKQR